MLAFRKAMICIAVLTLLPLVYHAAFGAHMGLHAEIPGVALLRAFHLGVPLAFLVLRRRWRMNDPGIHNRAFTDDHVPPGQITLRLLRQGLRETMPLQKVPELAGRRLVRHPVDVHPRDTAYRFHVIQTVLHTLIAQPIPLPHEVDPQYHLRPIRTTTPSTLRRSIWASNFSRDAPHADPWPVWVVHDQRARRLHVQGGACSATV